MPAQGATVGDQDQLLKILSHFSRTLVRPFDTSEALFALTERVGEFLDLPGVGISVADETGSLRFAAARNDTTITLERSQEELQHGPCADAYRSGAIVMSNDLRTEQRWPELTRLALDLGMGAVAGIPMGLDDARLGALNLYADTPRDWSADDLEAARVFADMATSYLLNASERERAERAQAQLQQALDSRVTIEQAKGILAGHYGISLDAAFDRLRHHARSHNANIRAVADAVVTLGLLIE
jgi:GAF domain-containing protein